MERYDIAKHFSAGFCAAILPSHRDTTKNEHWLAGWDAGYEFRKERSRKLNEYMVSTGRKPFGVVRLCSGEATSVTAEAANQAGGPNA